MGPVLLFLKVIVRKKDEKYAMNGNLDFKTLEVLTAGLHSQECGGLLRYSHFTVK